VILYITVITSPLEPLIGNPEALGPVREQGSRRLEPSSTVPLARGQNYFITNCLLVSCFISTHYTLSLPKVSLVWEFPIFLFLFLFLFLLGTRVGKLIADDQKSTGIQYQLIALPLAFPQDTGTSISRREKPPVIYDRKHIFPYQNF